MNKVGACPPPSARLCCAAVIRRLLIFLALGAVAGLPPAALAAQPDLKASRLDTDVATGDFVATGNARLVWENLLLVADEIRFNPRTQVATAKGQVQLTQGPRRLLADKLTYKLQDRSFTVEDLRIGEYPYYFSGARAEGTRDLITVFDAMGSYTEPHRLAPSVRAAKIVYARNKTVQADSARIGLGATVPISLPKFEQSVDDPFLSYMDATFGYRASLGAYLGFAAQIPVLPSVKLGGEMTYFSKRGLLLGPGGRYDTQIGGQELWGSFRSSYIHDTGERLQDVLSRPIPKDRGYVRWEHRQNIRPELSIAGRLAYWSDSEIVRDFVAEEFVPVQTPDSFLEGMYRADNYVVSLFTRLQPNDYIRVQQRLPELRYELLPMAIGLGFYERFHASLAVLRESAVSIYPTVRSDRFDAYYGISRPFRATEWFTFTPVAGARLTHYERATGGKDNYTRTLGEVGFDANLRTSGVFEYKNPSWGIDGIRHLLTPRLSYRYVPDVEKGRPYIPAIDRRVFSTYLQPLGLGDQRNVDELGGSNTLRLGLDNTFQTRHAEYGSRNLLIFNVAADLRVDRELGQDRWSDIHTEAIFTPANWLQLDIYQSVSPSTLRIRELNTGIRIVDGDVWSVRLGNRYLKHDIQEYILDGRYRLNEAYHPFARFHYDVRESRFVEQTVGLRQIINNLWTIDYAMSFYSGRRRESNFGFSLRVNLLGF